MNSPTKWTVAITAFFGFWLVLAPFVLGAPVIDQWNDVLVGSVILVTAGYNYSRERQGERLSRRVSSVNGLLGCWLLAAPFMLGVSSLLLWNDIIVGIGVVSLAMYNIYAAPRIYRAKAHIHSEEM